MRTTHTLRRELTTLREERAELADRMQSIVDPAEREGRDLRPDEAKKYDKLEIKLDQLDGQIRGLQTLAKDEMSSTADRSTMLGGAIAPSHIGGPENGVRTTPQGNLRGLALNVNERASTVPAEARERVAKAIENDVDVDSRLARYVIAAGDDQYRTAFRKWLRDPMSGHYEWTDEERGAWARAQSESRAMSLGTGSLGGFLVSFELDPQVLISGQGSVNPMRDLARTVITSENEARFVTTAGVTASWDAEATEVSDDTPTLAQPAITCFKGQAFVPVSFEVFEDSTDLGQQIQSLFLDAKLQLEATAFTTGSGTGQPKGIITAVSAVGGSVVTSAGSAVSLADIVANQNALPPRWRPRAAWMANLAIINQARQLPTGSGLTTSVVDDSTNPPRMLGWNVHENSQMDGTIAAGTTNDYVLLSGDFNQYVVADRVGTTIEFVPQLFGANQRPTGQRGFLLHWRTGGDVVIPDAFRLTNYSA